MARALSFLIPVYGPGKLLGLWGQDKKSDNNVQSPQPTPQAPTVEDSATKAGDVVKKKKMAAVGESRSIYSSPLGLAGEANVARKSLLGQ